MIYCYFNIIFFISIHQTIVEPCKYEECISHLEDLLFNVVVDAERLKVATQKLVKIARSLFFLLSPFLFFSFLFFSFLFFSFLFFSFLFFSFLFFSFLFFSSFLSSHNNSRRQSRNGPKVSAAIVKHLIFGEESNRSTIQLFKQHAFLKSILKSFDHSEGDGGKEVCKEMEELVKTIATPANLYFQVVGNIEGFLSSPPTSLLLSLSLLLTPLPSLSPSSLIQPNQTLGKIG